MGSENLQEKVNILSLIPKLTLPVCYPKFEKKKTLINTLHSESTAIYNVSLYFMKTAICF